MDIHIELNKVDLWRIINFHYNVGDLFFDVISYLLKYSLMLLAIRQNSMGYLQKVWYLVH